MPFFYFLTAEQKRKRRISARRKKTRVWEKFIINRKILCDHFALRRGYLRTEWEVFRFCRSAPESHTLPRSLPTGKISQVREIFPGKEIPKTFNGIDTNFGKRAEKSFPSGPHPVLPRPAGGGRKGPGITGGEAVQERNWPESGED